MHALIWKDQHDHDTFHVGTRYSSRIVTWLSITDEAMREVFGEKAYDDSRAMRAGEIYEAEFSVELRG